MNTALTPSHVLRAFAAMEESTLKRPASLVTEAKLKAAATTWVAILAPMMSAEVFADAVMAHMRDPEEGRFWPTPAHIIKQVGNISRDGVPSAATALRVGRDRSRRRSARQRERASREAGVQEREQTTICRRRSRR